MEIITTCAAMAAYRDQARDRGAVIGFVPTMGYLHAGHLSLVKLAQEHSDVVVVSIFVNPIQFCPGEDLARYPQDFEGDRAKLEELGVACVFYPTSEEMYPPGFQTAVTVAHLPQHLCGLKRPEHFGGVTTVVNKLFNIVGPRVAVFGEKDFQQLQVIKRMVADLYLPVEILGGALMREPDGLAMSSRNAYLSADERQRALCLYQAIVRARELFAAGERSNRILVKAMTQLIDHAGGRIDYINLVDPTTLEDVQTVSDDTRACLAVFIGTTRLIDNMSLA